jgi:DNA-binding MarR family transcriptional regulator
MHRQLLMNLLSAVYWFDDAVQANLEAQGFPRMSRAVSFILLNIAQGEHRAFNICKNLGISRQAVSQLLRGLRDRGLLSVRQDPEDRRSQIVDFSAKFAKQGAACAEILVQLETELGKRVGPDNLRVMRRALAADWGPPPTLHYLSEKEISHGKAVWEKDLRWTPPKRRPSTLRSRPHRRA